jgi:hypothetical protein
LAVPKNRTHSGQRFAPVAACATKEERQA